MKECYRLGSEYSLKTASELEEIGDVWYQRLKKIQLLLHTETNPIKIIKAKRIEVELIIILQKMAAIIIHLQQPIRPPLFPSGGICIS